MYVSIYISVYVCVCAPTYLYKNTPTRKCLWPYSLFPPCTSLPSIMVFYVLPHITTKMALHAEIQVRFTCFVAETNVTFSGYDSSLHISQCKLEGIPFFPFPLAPISILKKRLLHIKKCREDRLTGCSVMQNIKDQLFSFYTLLRSYSQPNHIYNSSQLFAFIYYVYIILACIQRMCAEF